MRTGRVHRVRSRTAVSLTLGSAACVTLADKHSTRDRGEETRLETPEIRLKILELR